jgi:hypothetical protein
VCWSRTKSLEGVQGYSMNPINFSTETRGGSFKEIELCRLSLDKPAKVWLTKVWFGLSGLSWTRSPRQAGVRTQPANS